MGEAESGGSILVPCVAGVSRLVTVLVWPSCSGSIVLSPQLGNMSRLVTDDTTMML